MAITQITAEEAPPLLAAGYRYVDVRTDAEFVAGHPTGALNIPVVFPDPATRQMTINAEFLPVVEAHFAKNAKIIVGCQAGGRSQRAAEMLVAAGFTSVVNMQGGFGGSRDASGRTLVPGWKECGLPISTDTEHAYAVLRRSVG